MSVPIRWLTPGSSNVRAITIDGDTVTVEYHSGTYAYLGVPDDTIEDLLMCMELEASAGKTVRRLLHPLPFQRLS